VTARRARLYLLWIGGCALAGWLMMARAGSGRCLPNERRCTPSSPLPEPRRTEAGQGGALIGGLMGLVAALVQDHALWKRRR